MILGFAGLGYSGYRWAKFAKAAFRRRVILTFNSTPEAANPFAVIVGILA